jgi:hypothetical protein
VTDLWSVCQLCEGTSQKWQPRTIVYKIVCSVNWTTIREGGDAHLFVDGVRAEVRVEVASMAHKRLEPEPELGVPLDEAMSRQLPEP